MKSKYIIQKLLCVIVIASFLMAMSCTNTQNGTNSDQTTQTDVLIQGSPIHGANGINIDQEDRLFVASVISRTIFHLDMESGEILETYSVSDSIDGPDDLAFGPDGSLYWTDILTGEVGRRSPQGNADKQFIAPGVNPITFSDDGRLFVALDFLGDALYELDPKLKNPPRLILENIGWLNAMDWGPDGYLYGPVWTKGQVIRVNVDNGEIEVVSDKLQMPAAVKFDSKGNLHVLDQMTGEVSIVDQNTGDLELVAKAVPGLDNLAFDSNDRLFIAHAQDGSIIEVLDDGSIRDVIPGGIIAAGGISLTGQDQNESLIVSDVFTIRKINVESGTANKVIRHFIGKPGLISPFTTSSYGGHIVLTSWFGNVVQVWDAENDQSVAEYHDFAVPLNAIGYKEGLVVAELGTQAGAARVVFENNGERTVLADTEDGLAVPSGLAGDKENLWVADWATGNILQLIKGGERLDQPEIVTTGLSQPEGLAVSSNGELYVVESGAGRVTRLSPSNQGEMGKSTVFDDLSIGIPAPPGAPPTWVFGGIAIGSDGIVYVSDDVKSAILKIDLQK